MINLTPWLVVHVCLVVIIGVRVIMRRPEPSVSLAWLFLVVLLPFAGALIYALFGERRLDPTRDREIKVLQRDYCHLFGEVDRHGTPIDWAAHAPVAERLNHVGHTLLGGEAVGGSSTRLYTESEETQRAMAADIDVAKVSVIAEFFIWQSGGTVDLVEAALLRAVGRGVHCRVLVDAIGARSWLKSGHPERLKAAGIEVLPALPVGLFRSFVGRTDLRLHRKITVIDGRIAWTGSMNMVDPKLFKEGEGFGEWVDANLRLEGPIVAPLGAIAIGDWRLESGEPLNELIKRAGMKLPDPTGTVDLQAVASGPTGSPDGLLQMMLTLINAADEELVITTPYLVPDSSLRRALHGAAARGVAVSIIMPSRIDSVMTRWACRSYLGDLMDAGVAIYRYEKGLLHTKSITVDGEAAMFGTVNFDMRSLYLNYEVTLCVYDKALSAELRSLQQTYIDKSNRVDLEKWHARSDGRRFIENAARLVSPLL